MIDIVLFINAINASWLKLTVGYGLLYIYRGNFIFESNFNCKDCNSMFKEMPFLCDIIKSWSNNNINSSIEDQDLLKQYLWNKSSRLFYMSWLLLGIKTKDNKFDYRHLMLIPLKD